jgi:hypothetical protein
VISWPVWASFFTAWLASWGLLALAALATARRSSTPVSSEESSLSNSSLASSGGSRSLSRERVCSAVSAIWSNSFAIVLFDCLVAPPAAVPMSVLILLSLSTAAL